MKAAELKRERRALKVLEEGRDVPETNSVGLKKFKRFKRISKGQLKRASRHYVKNKKTGVITAIRMETK